MNKEDVKKGYLAAMATMGIDANDAREYWESYEASQHWKVKNHGVSHHDRLSLPDNLESKIYEVIKYNSIEDEGMIKCVPLMY